MHVAEVATPRAGCPRKYGVGKYGSSETPTIENPRERDDAYQRNCEVVQ